MPSYESSMRNLEKARARWRRPRPLHWALAYYRRGCLVDERIDRVPRRGRFRRADSVFGIRMR